MVSCCLTRPIGIRCLRRRCHNLNIYKKVSGRQAAHTSTSLSPQSSAGVRHRFDLACSANIKPLGGNGSLVATFSRLSWAPTANKRGGQRVHRTVPWNLYKQQNCTMLLKAMKQLVNRFSRQLASTDYWVELDSTEPRPHGAAAPCWGHKPGQARTKTQNTAT